VRIELRHLRAAVATADEGSFSAAAQGLNADVSVVSRLVRDLELSIGISIFERHPRGVRVTKAGADYLKSARDILERLSQAEQDAHLAASGATGRLAIGFVWSFTGGPAVRLLQTYSSAYPQVAVRLVEDGNDELVQRVRVGDLDTALTATDPPPLPRLKPIDGLNSMPLWLEPLCVAVPARLQLESIAWQDLQGQLLLCSPRDDWRRFSRYVEALGGPSLRFAEQDVAVSSLFGLVAAGVGWLILPACVAGIGAPGVKIVPIVSEGASLQVEAVWRLHTANPALTRFLALLRQMDEAEPPHQAGDVASKIRDRLP
jgi:DNA-binding transcriptional LysR family regulator